MLNLEPMMTAVTFIENHRQDNIKVADMADAVQQLPQLCGFITLGNVRSNSKRIVTYPAG